METAKEPILLLLLLILNSCGFHLRGAVELPPERRVIALQGIEPNHPFARDLAAILALSGGRLGGDPRAAGSVLIIHEVREERRVLSLDEHGKAIEFELVYRVRFQARAPDGRPLLPQQALALHRVYLNTQVQVIGKAEEEGLIRREMRREAARTLLRRLQKALQDAD